MEEKEENQFDIKHLIANIPKPMRLKPEEIKMDKNKGKKATEPIESPVKMKITLEKSQPKKWGNVLSRTE